MQIDLMHFQLCGFCQSVRGELRFQRAQTVHVVGKKNEKLKIAAGIRNAHGGEALSLRVAELRGFAHRWGIDRRAAADVERFPLRWLLGKGIRPRRFEIERIRKHEPGQFVQCIRRNEITNLVVRLICHPFVDVLGGS